MLPSCEESSADPLKRAWGPSEVAGPTPVPGHAAVLMRLRNLTRAPLCSAGSVSYLLSSLQMSSAAVQSTGEWRAHSTFVEGSPTVAHTQSNASFTHAAGWAAASGGPGQEFDVDVADYVSKEVSLFDRQHVRPTPFNSAEATASQERDYDSASSAPSCWGRDGEGLGIKSAGQAPAPKSLHPNFFEQPQASQAFKKKEENRKRLVEDKEE